MHLWFVINKHLIFGLISNFPIDIYNRAPNMGGRQNVQFWDIAPTSIPFVGLPCLFTLRSSRQRIFSTIVVQHNATQCHTTQVVQHTIQHNTIRHTIEHNTSCPTQNPTQYTTQYKLCPTHNASLLPEQTFVSTFFPPRHFLQLFILIFLKHILLSKR